MEAVSTSVPVGVTLCAAAIDAVLAKAVTNAEAFMLAINVEIVVIQDM